MDDAPDDRMSRSIDLREIDLADVESLGNPVLVDVLQRIRDELHDAEEAFAGFDSSL